MTDTQPVDEQAVVVDTLAMQIARLSIEAAQWRARAITLGFSQENGGDVDSDS